MTSGEAAFKVVVAKLAYQLNFSVEVAYGNGWHLHTVEPVLLDHGVPGGIDERQPITGLELPVKAELAEDIARQAGFAADHVLMGAVAGFRSEEHTSELQSRPHLVCRLLLEKKKSRLQPSRLASPAHLRAAAHEPSRDFAVHPLPLAAASAQASLPQRDDPLFAQLFHLSPFP